MAACGVGQQKKKLAPVTICSSTAAVEAAVETVEWPPTLGAGLARRQWHQACQSKRCLLKLLLQGGARSRYAHERLGEACPQWRVARTDPLTESCHHHACTQGPRSTGRWPTPLEPQGTPHGGQQVVVPPQLSEFKRNVVKPLAGAHADPIDPGQGGQGSAGRRLRSGANEGVRFGHGPGSRGAAEPRLGPERLKMSARSFKQLFSDPETGSPCRLPALQSLWPWLISTLRSGKSQEAYRSIGGGSPLRLQSPSSKRCKLQSETAPTATFPGQPTYVPCALLASVHGVCCSDLKADAVDEGGGASLYPPLLDQATSGSSFGECKRLRQADPEFQSAADPLHPHLRTTPPVMCRPWPNWAATELRACKRPPTGPCLFQCPLAFPRAMWRKRAIPTAAHRSLEPPALMAELGGGERPRFPGGGARPFTIPTPSLIQRPGRSVEVAQALYRRSPGPALVARASRNLVVIPISFVSEHIRNPLRKSTSKLPGDRDGSWNSEFPPGPGPRLPTPPSSKGLADLVETPSLDRRSTSIQAAKLPTKVQASTPRKKWSGAENNSSEAGMGGWRMLGFSAFLLELIRRGKALWHALGLL